MAADFFHKRKIIHRDLKPENVLLFKKSIRENEVTIADFGFAKDLSLNEPFDEMICGTIGYHAPEVLMKGEYSQKSDIFSLGVILYNMISGASLFTGRNQREICYKNKHSIFPESFRRLIRHYSQEASDLLSKLVEKVPADRLSAEQALNHEWFRDIKDGISLALELNAKIFD